MNESSAKYWDFRSVNWNPTGDLSPSPAEIQALTQGLDNAPRETSLLLGATPGLARRASHFHPILAVDFSVGMLSRLHQENIPYVSILHWNWLDLPKVIHTHNIFGDGVLTTLDIGQYSVFFWVMRKLLAPGGVLTIRLYDSKAFTLNSVGPDMLSIAVNAVDGIAPVKVSYPYYEDVVYSFPSVEEVINFANPNGLELINTQRLPTHPILSFRAC